MELKTSRSMAATGITLRQCHKPKVFVKARAQTKKEALRNRRGGMKDGWPRKMQHKHSELHDLCLDPQSLVTEHSHPIWKPKQSQYTHALSLVGVQIVKR
mmetsp:Transcript_50282/g.151377  ORF Transcript_50282/g.151377 Transcript_50282/m.151377 type:complete len:100 (-) Transcript_50282:88-387(-)